MTPPARLPISVCLIAGNEAARIPLALASVAAWASEIIVVLNHDVNDGTDKICEAAGAKVFREPWRGFGPQKNFVAEKCSQPWLLNLDADEEVTPELQAEIARAVTTSGAHAAFSFPRCTSFQGRWIRHGDWYPDRQTRLWQRGRARWTDSIVHEKLEVSGSVGKLRGDLRHHLTDKFNRQVEKLLRYTDLFVEQRAAQARPVSAFDVAFRPVWRFLRGYVLRLGFLDGLAGFSVAWLGAFYTFARYSKALESQQKK